MATPEVPRSATVPAVVVRSQLAVRTVVLALGLPFVGLGVAQADTTIIGTASQSSGQASTMSQAGVNKVSPLPVVGQNHSKGTQNGVSTLSNSQSIPLGPDGLIDGSANQDSSQGAATTQVNSGSKTEANGALANLGNDQLIGDGGNIVGTTSQGNRQGNLISQTLLGSKVATDIAASALANSQIVGDEDGVIIGSVSQANAQADGTAQSVTQKASNPTIGNSTLTATSITDSSLDNAQGVAAGTIIGSALQGNTQGHDGTQVTKQSPAPVITGDYIPVQTTINGVVLGNCQTVSDGSASCLIFP
jgi:hypothetical protein